MDREFYLWLQTLIYALQLPDWRLEDRISRENAKLLVANSLDLNPEDPELLPKALLKLSQILAEKIEAVTVPPELQDWVKAYEEHLEEIRKNSLKEAFKIPPEKEVDEWIKKLYQDYRQKIHDQLVKPEKELEANPILTEEVSHQITINLIKALPPAAREKGPGSLSENDYRQVLKQLRPLVSQNLKWGGVKEPKIETDENVIQSTVSASINEAKKVAFVGRETEPIEKLLTPLERPVAEVPRRPAEAPVPKLIDLPSLKWQPSGIRVSPLRTTWAFSKKAMLLPFAKPLQWLIHLAPESFREENLSLVYAARGLTPEATDQTLEYLYKEKPESPEIPFWQGLKAVFKTEKLPFLTLFKHYYEWDYLGKAGIKVETLGISRLARIITFGRFENFPSLSLAFWKFFKGTRIGGWINRGAGKIITSLSKITRTLSMVGAVVASWETFKKVGKIALGALAYIFMWAAHYGTAAVVGATAGLIGGAFAGIKTGLMTFTALSPFLGPFAAIPAVIVGFVTWVAVTFFGAAAGVALQMLLDKIGAALGGTSLPQAGATGMSEASAAAASTAQWFVPVATATAVTGGLIVSQIVSSAFVIPSEEVKITSPYIEVTKTVEFSGNLGDPIRYTIEITAIDKDLSNVKVVDQATATCRGNPPDLDEHSWDGSIFIPAGETWEQTYTVVTNDQFNDCLISNTVRVTALVEGKTEESFSVGYVIIGNPPEIIPWGLPIHDNPQRGNGYTFGQMVPCYEDPSRRCPHQGIDVHGPNGATVYSTFSGESTVASLGYNARGGYYIILSSGKYQIYMGHLAQRPKLRVGDSVGSQAPVGIQGKSGHAFGEHVHYQIWESGIIVDPRRFDVPSPPW